MRTKRRGNRRNGVNLIRWKSGWRELVCCDSCRFCSLFIFLPTYFPPLASIKIPLYMCLTIRVYAVRICIKPKTINSLYHILVKILSKTYAHTHSCGAPSIPSFHSTSSLPQQPELSNNIPMKIAIFRILAYPLCTQVANASHCNKVYLF